MRSIAIYLGLTLAGALFALGIRALRVNRQRKYGLFVSTVLLALYLLGTRYAGAAEPAKSVHETTLSQKDRMQIAELVKTKEWQNFKAFWKKLDEIEPRKDKGEGDKIWVDYEGKYPGAISFEQAEELRKELKALTNSLAQVGGEVIGPEKVSWLITCQSSSISFSLFTIVNPVAGGWLEGMCYSRIGFMVSGFSSKYMRMRPDPSFSMREISQRDLEARIDALLLLQKKGKVNQEEYLQSLENIQEEIRRYSILSALGSYYVRVRFSKYINENTIKTNNIQDYIESLGKDYADYKARRKKEKRSGDDEKYYKELDASYDKARQELEQLKTRLPLMDKLIADLEQR